jgi:predicted ATPase/class 3 adenylate cyclase/DNA-binding CsgD family transcriptional regulator
MAGHRLSNEAGQRRADMRDLPTGTVTMLFTDIEGSTRLLQQTGEHYASVLTECRRVLRAAFHEHRGHEVDTQGDAFFVAFARATDAISAAVAAQRALATHSWPHNMAVRVRMGIHTGEPSLVTEGYVGMDVRYAARIMSAGHGGQVLLSQTTRELVEHDRPDGVSLRDLGEHRLKDLQRPGRLYQLVIADLPAEFPPLKTLDVSPNNLPVQFTPLIGREQEVAAVQNLLHREDVCLVTLTGPGGTGKTRLGLQVAAELSDLFPDGVYFVNLAPISDSEFVVPTIAQALSFREVTGQPLLDHLKGELQQKQLLLLLDNFEQVVSAAPQLVDLLAACPKLKLLVTSREVLHVRAEHEFAVTPMALPDLTHLPVLAELARYAAVTLFIERARAARPDFQVTTANAWAIAAICVHLDGLPLAIELAAVWIKLLPPQALLVRLDQRLQVLTSGARDAPVRQQSLRNTIAWSYELLHAEEQRLFRRLSVFVGGCTLETIEAVYTTLGDASGQVIDGVASLIDKNLLLQTAQEEEESRLVMLESIREFGLERLTSSGEREAIQQAHADYYLRLSEDAEPQLWGPRQVRCLQRLEQEHGNLRAALQWLLEQGDATQSIEKSLRLGAALRSFWMIRGYYSEGRTFLEQALARSEGIEATVRAKGLWAATTMANFQGDNDRAEALSKESLTLHRQLGDRRGVAYALYYLGGLSAFRGDLAAARSLEEEALALRREVGNKQDIAWSLYYLAGLVSKQGEYSRGRALVEESLALFRELGNIRGIAVSLISLAWVLFVSQSDSVTIRSLLEEGITLRRELDDKESITDSIILLGELALSQGDVSTARSLAEEVVVLTREIGNRLNTAQSLAFLAKVIALQGDQAAARAMYEESLALAKAGNSKWHIKRGLEGLAGVLASQGDLVWAARLWGAAEALRDAMGTPIAPVYRASYERSVATARTQLGEKAFAAAWAEGRAMTPEQALATQGREMIPSTMPARPASTSPVKSPTHPAGLTAREVEVLRLLAMGLTDAQIAEQLVLSLHTVHAHLRTIYSKLEVTSRTAATRYAFEHQLM